MGQLRFDTKLAVARYYTPVVPQANFTKPFFSDFLFFYVLWILEFR